MNQPLAPKRPVAQWLPAGAAVAVLATVVLAGVALGGANDEENRTNAEPAGLVDNTIALTVPDS
ncbi:MAG: hypothetical protein ACJAR2_003466, partial [Ilumatobacter sp.]